MRRVLAAAALLSLAAPATADELNVVKSVTIVSDPLGNLVPRSLPDAVAEYRIVATNPNGILKPVRNIVLEDQLPPRVVLRVTDLFAAGKGPVDFADGSLLGTGLLSSGVGFAYSTSAPTTDGLEFYNGTTWAYQPVPDAKGYDANVRAIRMTLSGTFTPNTSFQFRYQVKIR